MKYSNKEKLSIVARCQQGESIATLSKNSATRCSTLYRWLKSFPTDSAGKPLKFSYQEYTLLQRKVEKLQNIITILKSADCLVSAPLRERLHALEPFYGKYEIHTICEALDVDRGTFYNHMLRNKRENAWFEKRRQEYCQVIRECLMNIIRCWAGRKFGRFSFSVGIKSVRNMSHGSCVRWA